MGGKKYILFLQNKMEIKNMGKIWRESILTLEVSDCIIYLCALPYAHIFSPAATDASLSTENLSISQLYFTFIFFTFTILFAKGNLFDETL